MTKLIITLDITDENNSVNPKYNGPEVTWKRFLELLGYNVHANKDLSIRDGLSAPIDRELMIGHLRIDVEDPFVPIEKTPFGEDWAQVEIGTRFGFGARGPRDTTDGMPYEKVSDTEYRAVNGSEYSSTIDKLTPGDLRSGIRWYVAPQPEFADGFPVGLVVEFGGPDGTRYIKGEDRAWTGVYSSGKVQHLQDFDSTIRHDLESGFGKVIINPADTGKN